MVKKVAKKVGTPAAPNPAPQPEQTKDEPKGDAKPPEEEKDKDEPKAKKVKTVRMVRHEDGKTADVHPLEVENFRGAGFVVDE